MYWHSLWNLVRFKVSLTVHQGLIRELDMAMGELDS